MKRLLLIFAVTLAACSTSTDFSEITTARSSAVSAILSSDILTALEKSEIKNTTPKLKADNMIVTNNQVTAQSWTWRWTLNSGSIFTLTGSGDLNNLNDAIIKKE
jgi:hypothetical protein